jgi:transposase
VAQLDHEIGRRYRALDNYLVSIPGLGAATAPAIYAEIGDIQRFTDSDQVVALVGVDPQLQPSGQSAGQAKMSKRGSPYLRRAIWHAALSAARCDPMFRAIYERQCVCQLALAPLYIENWPHRIAINKISCCWGR